MRDFGVGVMHVGDIRVEMSAPAGYQDDDVSAKPKTQVATSLLDHPSLWQGGVRPRLGDQ